MAAFCIAANWFHNLSPFAQFRHDLALQPKNPPSVGLHGRMRHVMDADRGVFGRGPINGPSNTGLHEPPNVRFWGRSGQWRILAHDGLSAFDLSATSRAAPDGACCINITLDNHLCRYAKGGSGYLWSLARMQGRIADSAYASGGRMSGFGGSRFLRLLGLGAGCLALANCANGNMSSRVDPNSI